jgi:hypothetical protein
MTPAEVKAYQQRIKSRVPVSATKASGATVAADVAAGQDSVGRSAGSSPVTRDPSKKRTTDYETWLANQLVAHGMPQPALQFMWLDDRQYRADLAYPPLLIEIDGAAHRIKGRFMDDILKSQAALLNGYYLLRVATSQVRDGNAVKVVQAALERVQAYGTTFAK